MITWYFFKIHHNIITINYNKFLTEYKNHDENSHYKNGCLKKV